MDGGPDYDEVQSWLEMADRQDLLCLLSYLGMDMGLLPQDQLVKELQWSTCLTHVYGRTCVSWARPVILRCCGNVTLNNYYPSVQV